VRCFAAPIERVVEKYFFRSLLGAPLTRESLATAEITIMARKLCTLGVLCVSTWALSVLAASQSTTVLYFIESEQGMNPHATRMLVTPRFVRIDDGHDAADFLLFDRTSGTIYTTNSIDRRILVINRRPVTLQAPKAFRHRSDRDEQAYPAISGHKVVHYRLFTNKQLCFEIYASEGLLPAVQQALREFHVVLAGEQAMLAQRRPEIVQSTCELANDVFLPSRYLDYGFPIWQQDIRGARRRLVDYKIDVKVEPRLFKLPQGYSRFTMDELRRP
jgi:hypothetical protein